MSNESLRSDSIDEGVSEYLKNVLDSNYPFADSCLMVVTNGVITFVNDKICTLSKLNNTELTGQPWQVFTTDFHTKHFLQTIKSTVGRGQIWRGEIKTISKNGTHFWLETTIVPDLVEKGSNYRYIISGLDITDRKSADELINANKELAYQNKEKEKRADELVIANKELVFQNKEKEKRAAELIIADKELLFQNEEKEKRAAELIIADKELIYQNEEKEKRAAELIIADKELIFQNGEKEKRAAERIVAKKELIFQNEEKEKRAAELIIANKELAFQNEEKEKRAAELIIANKELIFQNGEKEKRAEELAIANRELKKAQDGIRKLNEELEQKVLERTEQLESANKELESFSYSVSHDLRAPLRAIHGYARMLSEDYAATLDIEANRIIKNVMNNAKKMGQLIDDLLKFSRLGRKELIQISIPMNEMVTNLCSEIKNEAGNDHVEFKIMKLQNAQGDSIVIKQVWLNLISNAIKYSKFSEKPVVEIGSTINGDSVEYYVKDNGVGFDMQYANKLFGVFQRLHSEDKFEGTGVGLAIVHRIVSKHGGKVWAEGEVNQGATFKFSLSMNKSI